MAQIVVFPKENVGGGHGPSWGQHLSQLERTWDALDRLESVGLVLGPFWLGFGAFGLRFGCILDPFSVRIGFARLAFVSC